MAKRISLIISVLFTFTTVALAATTQKSSDDTARFYGNWSATFPYNNVPVTILSIHDASGYKNYVLLPQGAAPAGTGHFIAANSVWTSDDTAAPNNTGSYTFIDNNTAYCTNALGQSLLWQRYNLPLPKIIGDVANGAGASLGNDLTRVKSGDAIKASRTIAAAWQADAVLVWAQVVTPNPDGTVNILAHPQALNFLYFSPSTNTAVSVVSTAPTGSLTISAPANVRPAPSVPIKPQAIDLSQAFTNAKLFGFNGNASQATLSFQAARNKPMRLVWEIQAGGSYPVVVSGATGALLSPFEIVDDKVADFNALAAARHAGRGRINTSAGFRSQTGINFWQPDAIPNSDNSNNQSAPTNETGEEAKNTALQNAYDAGDMAAYNRILNNEMTDADYQNFVDSTGPEVINNGGGDNNGGDNNNTDNGGGENMEVAPAPEPEPAPPPEPVGEEGG
jgi:hypothetical protein